MGKPNVYLKAPNHDLGKADFSLGSQSSKTCWLLPFYSLPAGISVWNACGWSQVLPFVWRGISRYQSFCWLLILPLLSLILNIPNSVFSYDLVFNLLIILFAFFQPFLMWRTLKKNLFFQYDAQNLTQFLKLKPGQNGIKQNHTPMDYNLYSGDAASSCICLIYRCITLMHIHNHIFKQWLPLSASQVFCQARYATFYTWFTVYSNCTIIAFIYWIYPIILFPII